MMGEEVAIEVNGERISAAQAIRSIVADDGLGPLQRAARSRLVAQLAAREGVRVTHEQVQAAVDEWRYERRLERAEDTEAWLSANGVTLCDVAERLRGRLLETALAERIAQGRVEPFFAAHSLAFDEVEVSWVSRRDEPSAAEITLQIRDEGADFHGLARRYSEDDRTRPLGGYLGRLRRDHLPKGVSPLVFAAAAGDVIGPLRAGDRFALYLVEGVFPATLDEGVRADIRWRLFEGWLAAEMRKSRVAYPVLGLRWQGGEKESG